MKTAILFLGGGLAIACILAAMPERAKPARLGGAIILDNDQLIEGDIRREGNRIIVCRGDSETELPASRVVEIVADRQAAVNAMRERSNRRDPDERMRLIRWCLENGLHNEALIEAEDFLKSRPSDTKLKTFVADLRQLAPPAAVPDSPPKVTVGKVIEIEPRDYNPESFGMFASKVQPILMNLCIGCHGSGKGGSFSLVRGEEGNRHAAAQNLLATLKYLNRGNPSESPFLLKSIAVHGSAARPPLRDRQHPAYANLEAWVHLAVASDGVESPTVQPANEPRPRPNKHSLPVERFGEASKSKPLPVPQTEAKDPFDPAIFNGTIQKKTKD